MKYNNKSLTDKYNIELSDLVRKRNDINIEIGNIKLILNKLEAYK